MSAENKTVIKVDHVYKDFKLPHLRKDTIKSFFTGLTEISTKASSGSAETQHALKDISFEIKKGEFFGIVGRNGSGKSTLLKILAGIYQPTKGSVSVEGRLVPFIELGVGFNPELTGRENIFLNGALLGFSRKKIEKMYDGIVQFAELEKFMDQKLKNYSSGMQVRLAFSMAIRAEADILLVDEVLAVGDADFQRKCFDFFRRLKKNKKTVVFVSHDMNAVREYCDRAILIEQSELIMEDNATKVGMAYTRMFLEEDNVVDGAGSDEKRWGDGKITYESVNLDVKKVTNQEYITITAKAKALEDIENPLFGFLIKNAAGVQILGTNNQIKMKSIARLAKGQKITLEWKVPNIFSDGVHFIDPAIVHHDGTVVSDWWEEAYAFTVVKEERTPYLLTPTVELEYKITG